MGTYVPQSTKEMVAQDVRIQAWNSRIAFVMIHPEGWITGEGCKFICDVMQPSVHLDMALKCQFVTAVMHTNLMKQSIAAQGKEPHTFIQKTAKGSDPIIDRDAMIKRITTCLIAVMQDERNLIAAKITAMYEMAMRQMHEAAH